MVLRLDMGGAGTGAGATEDTLTTALDGVLAISSKTSARLSIPSGGLLDFGPTLENLFGVDAQSGLMSTFRERRDMAAIIEMKMAIKMCAPTVAGECGLEKMPVPMVR